MSEWTPFGEALALVRMRLSLDDAAASDLLLEAIEDKRIFSRIRPDEIVEAMDAQALYQRERDVLLKYVAGQPYLTPERKLYPFTIDVSRASFDEWTAGLLRPHQKPNAEMILETGLPGRPEKGRTIILREFARRREAGETISRSDGGLAGEVRAILNWFADKYPDAKRPQEDSTKNLLRAAYNEATKRAI